MTTHVVAAPFSAATEMTGLRTISGVVAAPSFRLSARKRRRAAASTVVAPRSRSVAT
jgi:hypothetical protein